MNIIEIEAITNTSRSAHVLIKSSKQKLLLGIIDLNERIHQLILFYLVIHNSTLMSDIEEITQKLIEFRNDRDWEQFHNPKDLSLAISIEAGELLELFLWKNAIDANQEKVKEELADIFSFAFLLANKYGLDVKQIILDKIKVNNDKYPISKARGTAKKYNEL